MRQLWVVIFLLCLSSCSDQARQSNDIVVAEQHNAFWLWAGVKPQPVLETAQEVYILDSELLADEKGRLSDLRGQIPQVQSSSIWMVVRLETLRWPAGIQEEILSRVDRWETRNRLIGIQLDFDARTRYLGEYASFLANFRKVLPARYRLSITGLMDWSANGEPENLQQLSEVVDEVVIQTYQGRHTIPGYENYMARLSRLDMPYKIGIVQHGRWKAPPNIGRDKNFKGYVVFLLNEDPEKERNSSQVK